MFFKEVQVYHETLVKGCEWSQYIKVTPRSYNNGQKIIVGTVGEAIFQQVFPQALYQAVDNHDYDFDYKGTKVDVKTMCFKKKPKDFYELGLFKHPSNQEVDYYCFIALLNDFKTAWLMGFITPDEFIKHAVHKTPADTRHDGRNYFYEGWFIKMYNLKPLQYYNLSWLD
jgi:hypothetical protein